MHTMSKDNLGAALSGESQAHVKYLAFSEKAKQENLVNVARLFAAASFAEQVHAKAHLKAMSGVGTTSENLAVAIGGESFEVTEMYPAYIAVAREQGEAGAEKTFNRAVAAEKIHQGLYERAKLAVDSGKDADIGSVWVCGHCGFTGEGDAPDNCPLCGAPKERIPTF